MLAILLIQNAGGSAATEGIVLRTQDEGETMDRAKQSRALTQHQRWPRFRNKVVSLRQSNFTRRRRRRDVAQISRRFAVRGLTPELYDVRFAGKRRLDRQLC